MAPYVIIGWPRCDASGGRSGGSRNLTLRSASREAIAKMHEQLRRAEQEANLASSRAIQLQAKLRQQQQFQQFSTARTSSEATPNVRRELESVARSVVQDDNLLL
jgi:hypothetical protein